ncbi:hypothetical protein LCI18_003585 [Fusarium solani-melongenae]|uniref:Uncharacterized protein n=1 Tax=Fusarium solani subsp. cucurbitae TaxID=2747967 RepID=A0ACD3YUT8_FUSSC|nr:hypothetical protein LCI18_003585 [Fusarium solani-melongenae]
MEPNRCLSFVVVNMTDTDVDVDVDVVLLRATSAGKLSGVNIEPNRPPNQRLRACDDVNTLSANQIPSRKNTEMRGVKTKKTHVEQPWTRSHRTKDKANDMKTCQKFDIKFPFHNSLLSSSYRLALDRNLKFLQRSVGSRVVDVVL